MELMLEYGPDASRTPADIRLHISMLRINIQMHWVNSEGGRPGRESDILISNLAPGFCHI